MRRDFVLISPDNFDSSFLMIYTRLCCLYLNTSSNQGLWGAFDGTGMVLGIGCEGVF